MDRLLNNWKPERAARKKTARKAERAHKLTRAQCKAIVWRRAKGKCERCRRPVDRDVALWRDNSAHFNERKPKSLGGSDTDTSNVNCLCRKCHFGGKSGAHAPTADRMVKR